MHRRCCVLCLPFELVFAIKYATGHYRCSIRLWLGLCLNGGPDPATPRVQRGTPLHVLQELGGWQPAQMVRRYAYFSAGSLAVHTGNFPVLMAA